MISYCVPSEQSTWLTSLIVLHLNLSEQKLNSPDRGLKLLINHHQCKKNTYICAYVDQSISQDQPSWYVNNAEYDYTDHPKIRGQNLLYLT